MWLFLIYLLRRFLSLSLPPSSSPLAGRLLAKEDKDTNRGNWRALAASRSPSLPPSTRVMSDELCTDCAQFWRSQSCLKSSYSASIISFVAIKGPPESVLSICWGVTIWEGETATETETKIGTWVEPFPTVTPRNIRVLTKKVPPALRGAIRDYLNTVT